ncbi:TetR/AcrR family transcriptional regulator [Actinosynnema sp. NPDC047251]|uniref:TetR/AcrR family transcriptional regulator n=1 Tax=Saccharothrix espanaensis TaxID=103731 RepID=UPI000688792F|nr:TetR/AcrR family transcriptional regulator [Saccharothrix espanaensis]
MSRALTPKGEATKARIVAGAARLLRDRNVADTTLDDIRAETGTSKSQLFHYFPDGKDELLLAVARHEADQVIDDQQPRLGDLSTWAAWDEWRDIVVRRYRDLGDNCPLGSLFLQVGRSGTGARSVVDGLLRRWEGYLADGMRALQAGGRLDPAFDVPTAARALLTGLQGGVTIMLSTGSADHLEAAIDWSIARMRESALGGDALSRGTSDRRTAGSPR